MKHLLLTTIAAVVLARCGQSIYIHEAAWRGNIKVVKQHIAADIDVNLKNERGSPLLHLAVNFGYNEIAKLLIAKGADVNVMTGGKSKSQTPLDFAKSRLKMDQKKDHQEIAKFLRKHGGKTSEKLKAEGKQSTSWWVESRHARLAGRPRKGEIVKYKY